MIDSYEFGRVVVDGKAYTSDLVIFPDRVDDTWWRKQGHSLAVEDIEAAMQADPEVLVVGTGVDGLMQVPEATAEFVKARGTDLMVARSERACELYNEVAQRSRAVAALHLTC